jgi:hypothetical protein
MKAIYENVDDSVLKLKMVFARPEKIILFALGKENRFGRRFSETESKNCLENV